jgi:putative glycosyltransferase (TIGR04348 family)
MKTALISLPAGALGGNRTTALRWARILRQLGWDVIRAAKRESERADLILALHAVHTRAEVERLQKTHPAAKLIIACTGTDIYQAHAESQELLDRADKIIVLQERALNELSSSQRERARVIHQSTPRLDERRTPKTDHFEVALVANLRAVKDPLLPARAARLLPQSSRVQIVHVGAALDAQLEASAREESEHNPRYEWRGHVSRLEALTLLASSHAVVLPSRSEGGANLITEAFAMGTAVIASDIRGNVGLLGEDHPGLFPTGDAAALAALLARIEAEEDFLKILTDRSRERAWMSAPSKERESWKSLLAELL